MQRQLIITTLCLAAILIYVIATKEETSPTPIINQMTQAEIEEEKALDKMMQTAPSQEVVKIQTH